jgi:hypothetical protein
MINLKYIAHGVLGLSLALSFNSETFAATKKKKKKKSAPSGESTDAAPAEASASTESSEVGGGYKAAYGAAGCGLGSIVLGAKPGFMQVFASTTNGTFGSQTFGISTGTSNCKESGGKNTTAVEKKVYVEMNLASLAKDASQGEGDHLLAFADIFGCAESEADLLEFQALSQSKYSQLFSSTNSDVIVGGFVQEIRANPSLNANCVRVN